MALAKKDLDELKKRLEAERDGIIARTRARAAEALSDGDAPSDDADVASSMTDQALELRLADKDRKLLHLVEHALDKFGRGDYGLCEGTGEPIGLARLRARPWARFSVAHKERLERERALHAK